MREFKDIFESYGADYEATMERFMGNKKMYLKFLTMFFQDPSLALLAEALRADNLTGAFHAAHTLKGVAGNMGLAPFYDAVCAIVEPLRKGEPGVDYEELLQVILSEYQRVKKLRDDLGETAQG